MIVAPHFSAHFAFNSAGEAVVVEQDSPADETGRVFNVCVCPIGFREDQPDFGIPELLFKTVPLDLTTVQEQVSRWAELSSSFSERSQEEAIREVIAEVGA